jgi:hypothetical protein
MTSVNLAYFSVKFINVTHRLVEVFKKVVKVDMNNTPPPPSRRVALDSGVWGEAMLG